MEYKVLIGNITQNSASLITPLHNIALENCCSFRIDEIKNNVTLVYSARNFKININNGAVSFSGEFDPRAFYKLYSETVYDKVNELLFGTAEACSLCINDKCTTFLMADKRIIEWNGNTKKLCGPYRHHLNINVSEDNVNACETIVNMMFEYTWPHMHADIFYKNEVTYTIAEKKASILSVIWHGTIHSQNQMKNW